MPEERPTIETIILPAGGSIPGIPGTHGVGTYIVNWADRTITPVDEAGSTIAPIVFDWETRTIAPTGIVLTEQTEQTQEGQE